jgi:hypothetical protein
MAQYRGAGVDRDYELDTTCQPGSEAGNREAHLLAESACTELAYLRRAAMSAEPTLRGTKSICTGMTLQADRRQVTLSHPGRGQLPEVG